MALSPKQKAFCEYYASTGNATESALKAGYSKRTARSIAAENLTKLDIQDYLRELNLQIKDKRIADIKEVQQMWTAVLRDANEKTADRLKASEYIAKMNGAFLDKVEVKAEVKKEDPLEGLTTEELRQLINAGDTD